MSIPDLSGAEVYLSTSLPLSPSVPYSAYSWDFQNLQECLKDVIWQIRTARARRGSVPAQLQKSWGKIICGAQPKGMAINVL